MAEMQKMNDQELEGVSGGTTREYRAAWDVINGAYGAGQACRNNLYARGLDADYVLYLADGLARGYGSVAQDVINNVYGTDQERKVRLAAAGYDPALAQAIVNGMLMNS